MKYPIRLIIFLLLAVAGYTGYNNLTPVSEVRTSEAKTTVSAEEIKRILELNGASVKVHVETDTVFTEIKMRELFGIRLNFEFLEKEEVNRLVESRTWLIKAGVTDFELQDNEMPTLLLAMPVITSKEHLVEDYTVKKRIGVWNPVTMKQLELQSHEKAVRTAIDNGLLTEAKYSIENALHAVLPENFKIGWKDNK